MESETLSRKANADAKTVRIGTYRNQPREVREACQRNDLILQLGIPFVRLLTRAEQIRDSINASRLSREDKRTELACAWYGRFEAANGL